MKVKRCTVELVFDIWENDLDVNDVPKVIEAGVEKMGYALYSGPNVVMVKDIEVEEEE